MTDLLRPISIPKLDAVGHATAPISHRFYLGVKRAMDIAVALAGLIVALPAIILIAALVRIDSVGPVFFRQTRMGAGGRLFRIVKFRTMINNAEEILAVDPDLRETYERNNFKLPVELDARVTRVGRFLRQTSLDEVPQLWNVLMGDMSLVGARPVEPPQAPLLYGSRLDWYCRMRPGLTGHWQVSGRSEVGGGDRADLDMFYLRNWTLGLDLRIMLKTVPAVLRRHGAH